MEVYQPAQPVRLTIPGQINQPDEVKPSLKTGELEKAESGGLFGDDGFSFKDILDVINPFQQLPVVSSLYREESGDTISAASRLAGGALLGGPVGFLVALANTLFEEATGSDVGSTLLAAAKGSEDGEETVFEQTVDNPMPVYGAAARGHYSAYVKAQSLLS